MCAHAGWIKFLMAPRAVVLAVKETAATEGKRGGYYPDKKECDGGENKVIFFTIADAVRYVQSLSTPNGDYDNKF